MTVLGELTLSIIADGYTKILILFKLISNNRMILLSFNKIPREIFQRIVTCKLHPRIFYLSFWQEENLKLFKNLYFVSMNNNASTLKSASSDMWRRYE